MDYEHGRERPHPTSTAAAPGAATAAHSAPSSPPPQPESPPVSSILPLDSSATSNGMSGATPSGGAGHGAAAVSGSSTSYSVDVKRRANSIATSSRPFGLPTQLSPHPSSATSTLPSSSSSHASRCPKGIAFFVDLTSPVSLKPLSLVLPPRGVTGGYAAPPPSAALLEALSPDTMHHQLSQRLIQASLNRASLLHERRFKLRARSEYIKRKVLLQRHRERLTALKRRAKIDFAQSAAAIKRQVYLHERAEFFGALVERAQNVAIMKRLEACVRMRKSFSMTFADLLSPNVSLDDYLDVDEQRAAAESVAVDRASVEDRSTAYVSPTSPISPSHAGHLVNRGPAATSPGGSSTSSSTMSPRVATTRTMWQVPQTSASGVSPTSPASSRTSSDGSTPTRQGPGGLVTTAGASWGGGMTRSASMPLLSPSVTTSTQPLAVDASSTSVAGTAASPLPTSAASTDLEAFLPPVTRYTLRELDVTEILANVQLRHDLLFDPDMQFRPNVDGERGVQRMAKNEAYWAEIDEELRDASTGKRSWFRVPLLLLEIKEIVRELIPPSTAFTTALNDAMDIELITQQLSRTRTLAVEPIVAFLADQLHQYCAPCRDPLIDTMTEQFKRGEFSTGFQTCFEVLEFMKLDFANHHLKKLRPWIVENAAEFEWKYFKERFDAKLVTVDDTQRWFEGALNKYSAKPPANVYNAAFVDLIADHDLINNPSHPGLPETFRMDVSRITSHHNEYQDISIMAALLMLFKQACGKPGAAGAASATTLAATKQTLWILLNHPDTTMEHVALQLAKDAGAVRNRTMTAAETASLHRLVDTTLTFDHPLFVLLQRRVGSTLVGYLDAGGTMPPPDQLARVGLGELREELEDLGKKIKQLTDHNRKTYALLYDAMTKTWREGQPGADGGAAAGTKT
ncbi:Protein SOSEKI 1 [Blastocladiella emersonii ATCC 22665]|nr:Protein SOSEKI 1 [Blastocladiella emersonii ATCC 22665]